MKYPCIEIDLNKINHNTNVIVEKCLEKGIYTFVVTKVYCADINIAEASMNSRAYGIADSRISNLKKLEHIKCPKMLLRIPMLSEIEELVQVVDIALVSELDIIKKIGIEAIKIGKKQQIILMIDLGDLREGVWYENAVKFVEEVLDVCGVELVGIGTNLTCYGGVIPEDANLNQLVSLKKEIEKEYGIKIKYISGGNSSSLYKVLNNTINSEINMLRIGESIVLGRETAYGDRVNNTYDDAFILKGEIVELKEKPSMPIGNIGMDAFGNTPVFEDKGTVKRAIIAIGRQDVRVEGLMPINEKIEIIGASSDHMILDVTNSEKEYRIGDIIDFTMDYGAVLSAMTSEYVERVYRK